MDHLLLHCLVTRMLCSLTSNLFGVHHLLNLYQNLAKKKTKTEKERRLALKTVNYLTLALLTGKNQLSRKG